MQMRPVRNWRNPKELSNEIIVSIGKSKKGQLFSLLYTEGARVLFGVQKLLDVFPANKFIRVNRLYKWLIDACNEASLHVSCDAISDYIPPLPDSIWGDDWNSDYGHESWFREDVEIFTEKISSIRKPYRAGEYMSYWAQIQLLHEEIGFENVIRNPERYSPEKSGKLIFHTKSKIVEYYPENDVVKKLSFNKGDRYKLLLYLARHGANGLSFDKINHQMGWDKQLDGTNKIYEAVGYIRDRLNISTRELIIVKDTEIRYNGKVEIQD